MGRLFMHKHTVVFASWHWIFYLSSTCGVSDQWCSLFCFSVKVNFAFIINWRTVDLVFYMIFAFSRNLDIIISSRKCFTCTTLKFYKRPQALNALVQILKYFKIKVRASICEQDLQKQPRIRTHIYIRFKWVWKANFSRLCWSSSPRFSKNWMIMPGLLLLIADSKLHSMFCHVKFCNF